ncbi:MAG: STAS domain-containing protein [Bacteroidota bacterium]
MEINTKIEQNITVIEVSGNLDGNTAPVAQEKIMPLLISGCRLVFDMGKCNYISSAGLRLLLVIAKQLDRVGGTGAYAALTQETNDVMKITGFDNMFISYPTVTEAVKSFGKI